MTDQRIRVLVADDHVAGQAGGVVEIHQLGGADVARRVVEDVHGLAD